MATKKFVSKDNLSRVWTRLFGKVLNSKEEIEANTSENMIAGATSVKELYSSLESNNEHFYYDVQNGVRGFNTDPARGADTFYPFNRINGEIVYRPSSPIEGYTLNASPNSYYLIQCMNYQGGRKFTFTGAEIIFTAMSANYSSSSFSHTYIIKATSDNVNIVASGAMYGVVISKLT